MLAIYHGRIIMISLTKRQAKDIDLTKNYYLLLKKLVVILRRLFQQMMVQ